MYAIYYRIYTIYYRIYIFYFIYIYIERERGRERFLRTWFTQLWMMAG